MNAGVAILSAPGWRSIVGQPGYRVHKSGAVWSDRSQRLLKGSSSGRGYRYIQFPNGSQICIHRLVCEAFHGPRPTGCEVRHLDGDKHNNAASNLAWGTSQENQDDKKRHGTTARGESNTQAKLTVEAVAQMRRRRAETGETYKALGAMFGVSGRTASRAVTGENWK